MVIRQGDVLWVDFGQLRGSAPGYRRPAVVVQCNRFNESNIGTVVVVIITSTLKLQHAPGNVRLARGEGRLTEPSVANVSQIATVDRAQILRKMGALSRPRMREIIQGVGLILGAEELDA